jgi:hypothetical protein
MKTSEIEAKLSGIGKVHKYKGLFVARRGYFYTNGYTVDRMATEIRRALGDDNVEIVDIRNVWQSWPKDSYWEVKFRYEVGINK